MKQPAQAAPVQPVPSSPEGISKRAIPAIRIKIPPRIDGDLSDPAWQQAAKAEGFTDRLTVKPAQDQTIAYLCYDDRNVYVAFHAFDSQPKGIVARQTKRGSPLNGDDFVVIALDLYHSHQQTDLDAFFVNPLGTQYAQPGGGRATKLEWEGKWQAAARIVRDGWTAEMAIPWEILNHPSLKGPVTCGLDLARYQERTKTLSDWTYIGRNGERLDLMGHWVGVEFPVFRSRLSLLPYTSPGWQEPGTRGAGGGKSLRSGLDLRDTLTPALTLVGTINPDFGNVEGAVEGIDFSYGPRFVPDRRPFFQEGADFYGTSGQAGNYFYSARVPAFDTGVNLYGKLDPRDSLGVLTALDPGSRADWVLGGSHQFGPTSNAGFFFINRDAAHISNRIFGPQAYIRRGWWSVNANWAGSWLGTRQTGGTATAYLSYQSPRWFAQLTPHYVSPNFRDDLGFIPFTDYRGLASNLQYSREWHHTALRSFSIGGYTNDSDHYDGRLFRQQRGASFNLQSRSDYSLGLGWDGGRFEQFNDSVFSLNLGARVSDPFHNYGLGYSWGRRAGAPYTFITPYTTWRFGRKLTLGVASSLLSHKENAQQHIVTFNYDFSPQQGIGGRLVAQTGGTNGYFSYRHSGYGGTETFLILGDPNAARFRKRVVFKVVWAM